ncbi:MAG: nitrous oxide reductase accessory protein NosL [Cytophagales bacterium]|nr:nitrous oxide reductase accessory protein NosL [Cytophagales bacterium]
MKMIGLVRLGLALLLMAGFQGCSTDPEPLEYGKDVCHFCKMTLMDHKFGAELVTRKGKIYKFDDMNCMLNFYHSGQEATEDFRHKLVANYEEPGTLISADVAFFVKSPAIRSPMASEVAAFDSYEHMGVFQRKMGGVYLAWGEMLTQFK